MDIFDSESSVKHDIAEAVEAIFRYIEKCPYKGVYPVIPPEHGAAPHPDPNQKASPPMSKPRKAG